jgi:hypothetical protein
MTDEIQIMKLKGKMMYPKLFHPDTRYEPKWTVDLLLDAAGKKQAAAESLRVKKNDNYKDKFDGYDGSYIRVERPVKNRDGVDRDPPVVKDAKVRDVPSSTGIGNGTDAIVRFMVKTKDNKGKEMTPAEVMKLHGGYGMFLTGVQITNLVPYERGSDPDKDFVEEEGTFDVQGDGGFDFEKGDMPFDV